MSDLGGVDFNFTYAPGVSLEQMIGFEMAGEFWSQHLDDNASINIFVEMTDYLPENVIGGSLPGIEDEVLYSTFRQKLEQDITSDVDSLINENQQGQTNKFTAYFSSQYEEDGYTVKSNEYMKMTRANAKALDIIDPHDSGLDGYILIRDLDGVDDGALNSIRWHYDYSDNSIPNDHVDFLSVAIHEIGHTLGYISGIDQANFLAEISELTAKNEDDFYKDLKGNLNNTTPLDMLRFSQASYEESDNGHNFIDMSIGGDPYLSFTGGSTSIAYFSTGVNQDLGGDGYQASHWQQQDNALGIMDPVLATGRRREITELDIQVFDGIGWDIRTGDADLETIHTEAKEVLAEEISDVAKEKGIDIDDDVLEDWVEGELEDDNELDYVREIAELLTPDYIDADNDDKDDRGEKLQEMIVNSGDVYEWGWRGYWWGWRGYWWGWRGYWQSGDNFNQDGFWQNLTWQTVEGSNTPQLSTESSQPDISAIFDNAIPGNSSRDYNPFNRKQHKNLSRYEENESLLSKPEKQNTEDYKWKLSHRNELINKEEDRKDPLSGDLISEPLVVNITEEELLMM